MKQRTCTMVVPPNIKVMLTGVQYARIFADGTVQLTYINGQTESRVLSPTELTASRDDWFSLVSAVQSRRVAAKSA